MIRSVVLAVCICASTGCGEGSTPSGSPSAADAAAEADAVGTADAVASSEAASGHLFTNDFVPPTGAGSPPSGAGGGGPWSSRIKLATSPDGLAFTKTDESITDQAGVPNAVVGPDGLLRVYYNAWFNKDLGYNVIGMAIRSREGKWFFHKVNIASTLDLANIADPSVVVLPNGSYRLYFMINADKIVSAISTDSHDFTVDQESSFNPKNPLFDPTVLRTDSGYVMATGPDGEFFATSTDGLTFTEKAPLDVAGKKFHAWAGTNLAGSAGYRLYGYVVGEPSLSTMFSKTGATWAFEKTVSLAEKGGGSNTARGADLGVALMPDGTYTMVYLEPISPK